MVLDLPERGPLRGARRVAEETERAAKEVEPIRQIAHGAARR